MDDIHYEVNKILEHLEYKEKDRFDDIERMLRDIDRKLENIESGIENLSSRIKT